MGKVTLIATGHNALGQCNEDELLKILEDIRPDTIFEEIRPADFESFYLHKSKQTLETRTIARYLTTSFARQVPVDDFDLPENLPTALSRLFHYVETNSPKYCELLDQMDRQTYYFGFQYLNSPEYEERSQLARESFERAIATANDDSLSSLLLTWNNIVRLREASMVENIYAFCRSNQVANGVLLVGAAHRVAIRREIEARIKLEPDLVELSAWPVS